MPYGGGMDDGWRPDILGEGFEQLTLPIEDDDETHDEPDQQLVATLVRALPTRRRLLQRRRGLEDVDVLAVHGWSDYFLHRRLARFWTSRGARFFALDLRRYGRSIRPGQRLGYVADLAHYDAEIQAAIAVMRATRPGRRLVLLGHSTGGLTLSLWAHRNPSVASALILNSPWLELQLGARSRVAITPVADLHGRLAPMAVSPRIDLGFYARAQREAYDDGDPYEIEHAWRPERSMDVHAGWVRAILAGHARVAQGLSIDAPICILLSAASTPPTRWSDELTRTDSVIAVDEVAKAALRLGPSLTIERIDGALHDVFLSRREARDDAYRRLGRWVDAMLVRR